MTASGAPLVCIEITEWDEREIPGVSLTAGDQHLSDELQAKGRRLLVDELRTGVRVTSRSWVGVVRFESFEVRIVPKLAGDNLGLVRMIEFATGLEALRRTAGARTLDAQGARLFDLIVLLLTEATEQVFRNGLLADYVEREDQLPVVRGRFLGDQQVLRRFGIIDRLICRFDEHEQDVVENQLLSAALARCSTRVADDDLRRRVRRLSAALREVCSYELLDAEAVRERITYHRLNEHYRQAHRLAWLVLDGLGVEDLLAPGAPRCFAFLIDMNRLFEQFVFRVVDRLFSSSTTRVRSQRQDRSIVVDVATNSPYMHVVPDLLVETATPGGHVRLAIDAKYKLYDERKVDSADVYQTFLYAHAYGGARSGALPKALLFYPSSTRSSRPLRLRVGTASNGAEILILGLSIPSILVEFETSSADGPATRLVVDAVRQTMTIPHSTPARMNDWPALHVSAT